MKFNKLALAAAVAAAPATGMAMEPMTDGAMSGVTGQDGISISLSTQLSTDVIIHDKDGFTSPDGSGGTIDYTNSGAIVINNFGLSDGAGTGDAVIGIDIDAGSDGTGTNSVLNIDITLGNATTDTLVDLGTLSVADTARTYTTGAGSTAGTGAWGVTNDSGTLIDLGSVTIGGNTSLGIQLANEPQGHMALMETSITGGLSLSSFSISDASVGGGVIGMDNLTILDATGETNLALDVGVDVTTSGLLVTLNQFGDPNTATTPGVDMRIENQYLGSATGVIGDVEVVGLNLNGTTLTITGN